MGYPTMPTCNSFHQKLPGSKQHWRIGPHSKPHMAWHPHSTQQKQLCPQTLILCGPKSLERQGPGTHQKESGNFQSGLQGYNRQYPIHDLKPPSHYTMTTSQLVPSWLRGREKTMQIDLQAPAGESGAAWTYLLRIFALLALEKFSSCRDS